MTNNPMARREGVVVEVLADEVLIYDTERDKAHCLNRTAALVWQACDGQAEVSLIARTVSEQVGQAVDEEVVWYALSQLSRAHLLAGEGQKTPGRDAGMSRREMVRRLGIGAAVALPVVASIVAPRAVEAATCLPAGSGCTSGAQCCSTLCDMTGHCT